MRTILTLYSLLLAEDLGLDRDGDGTLTEAEEAKLSGFDANWVEGYNGDLELTLEDQVLALSGPLEPTSRMVEGRIVSTHLREVAGEPSISGDTLIVKAYDPTFYTDYQITLPVKITGNSACSFEKYVPDIEGELAKMRAFLLTLDADADLEENDIPLMGERFATEIRVTCPSS